MANQAKELLQKINNNMEEYKENDYYKNLVSTMNNSPKDINLVSHYIQQEIDKSWIIQIEKTIIPLDNIIRAPRKFIKNDEDIVPIALARGITTESIRHLAQHTNMIAAVEDDTVTPDRILEIRKEESYETYENRFIFTLLNRLNYFLDKRMKIINDKVNGNNEFSINYSGSFNFLSDKVNYSVTFDYESSNRFDAESIDDIINQDVTQLSSIQRIERIRRILYDFQRSHFAKQMVGAPLIKPPLTITNLLGKNPDYKACVELWMTLERYQGTGVSLNVVDRQESAPPEMANKLMQFNAMQFMYLKDYTTGLEDDEEMNKHEVSTVIEHKIEEVINNYNFNITEVKRIFLDRLLRKEQKVFAAEKRMIAIIKEALNDEKDHKKLKEEEKKRQRFLILQARKELLAKKKKELLQMEKSIDKETKSLKDNKK